MSESPKCLRCGAGAEWIKGRVPDEPPSELVPAPGSEAQEYWQVEIWTKHMRGWCAEGGRIKTRPEAMWFFKSCVHCYAEHPVRIVHVFEHRIEIKATLLQPPNGQALRPDGRSAQDSQQPTKEQNAND